MEFNITPIRLILGILVNLEIWILFATNVICLICIYRGRLCHGIDSHVYIISGLNLLVEAVQIFIHLIYIGPSILLGGYLFESRHSWQVMAAACIFIGLWYYGSLIQMLMAVNRFCAVCFPSRHIFTKSLLSFSIVFLFLFAVESVVFTHFLSPCCSIISDPFVYSYSYLPAVDNSTANYSLQYMDYPIDVITSMVCAISYGSLFVYCYRMRKLSGSGHRKELRICVQFVIVFLCYGATWVTFFYFPVLGIEAPEAYCLTTVVLIANSGVNSIIYFLMNKQIQTEARKLFGLTKLQLAHYLSTNRPSNSNPAVPSNQNTK